jgi:2-oxoglutarate ferredoxin oxidoreductase subunit alpha
MVEMMFLSGNEAVARGAIAAGCRYFFGYPITPQSDIPEFLSRELPKLGGVYLQTESEVASIYMVYGGALAGARVMTSTSSPGFSLMQEGLSYIAELEAPAVIVNVMRMGPGIGTGGQGGQTDYRQVTKGGGHGGYRCIVLAPASSQEAFDLTQLAFHLADKYRMAAMVLSDFIVGQTAEPVTLRRLDFGPLPDKDWALVGKDKKGGKRSMLILGVGVHGSVAAFHQHQAEKYERVAREETRYETCLADDARLLLAAYGSSSRIARRAVELARAQGLKVGLFRPITVWPFPEAALKEAALRVGRVLAVEDSQGQFVEDVRCAVEGRVPVHFLGLWARHDPGWGGVIHPERVLEEIRSLLC